MSQCSSLTDILPLNILPSITGGTDIYSGMACAARVLDSRKSRNPISCVFLLTDGQDSSHMTEKIALARLMKTKGYSLFVFGFGNDHDAEQLQNIAGAAEAPFTFIEADTMVVDAFGGMQYPSLVYAFEC